MFVLRSEICHFRRLQLKLQFVSDQGDEFRIGGFSLGIADGVAEKSLERIQVASVPGHFDGMADGSFHSGRGGLEGLCHLGIEDLGDGIGVPYGPPGSLAGCSRRTLQRLSANVDDLLLSLSSRNSLLYGFENMIAKPNRKVKREPNEHFRKFSWKLSKQFPAQLSTIYMKFGIVKTFLNNLIFLKHLAGDSWHRRHPLLLARCFFVV